MEPNIILVDVRTASSSTLEKVDINNLPECCDHNQPQKDLTEYGNVLAARWENKDITNINFLIQALVSEHNRIAFELASNILNCRKEINLRNMALRDIFGDSSKPEEGRKISFMVDGVKVKASSVTAHVDIEGGQHVTVILNDEGVSYEALVNRKENTDQRDRQLIGENHESYQEVFNSLIM